MTSTETVGSIFISEEIGKNLLFFFLPNIIFLPISSIFNYGPETKHFIP